MGRLIFLFLLLINYTTFGQDIVYDTIIGDRLNWRRLKVGSNEDLISIAYENLGLIARSKVLLSAGIWSGLQEGKDYKLIDINKDTIIFEYKSNPPLNLLLYKYYYNDTTYLSFFGLRKAELGSELFTGRYLFVCPIIKGSIVNVYEGIGTSRKLFMSVTEEIDENLYKDYIVSGQITFQTINGSRNILTPTILEFIRDDTKLDNIDIYPNPADTYLHIQILNNPGVIMRIFNIKPQLIYEQYLDTDITYIDVSNYNSGNYVLVFSTEDNKIIKYTYKLVIK